MLDLFQASDVNWCTGVLWLFLSDSHSDGTHSLLRHWCNASCFNVFLRQIWTSVRRRCVRASVWTPRGVSRVTVTGVKDCVWRRTAVSVRRSPSVWICTSTNTRRCCIWESSSPGYPSFTCASVCRPTPGTRNAGRAAVSLAVSLTCWSGRASCFKGVSYILQKVSVN